jgi:glyoxylase-like metal-dependent hydrolase (beta-lactamase superfamily II)
VSARLIDPLLTPRPSATNSVRVLLLETLAVGPFQCNCSVVGCPDTKEAVVVDPGGEPERILEIVRHYDLTVRWLVHTHAHLDHIAATRDVKETTEAAIALHRDDLFLYDGFSVQAAMFGWHVRPVLPVDRFLVDGDRVDFGQRALSVLHTPGHTPGSVCFTVEGADRALLFAGDTLFRRSIGRTDLPGGDHERIERSIRERLYALDPETVVITGHGPSTRIGEVRRSNPFVRS